MKLGKIEEDITDIFQEILDDFHELEFQFQVVSPGHFQMTSKRIDRNFIGYRRKIERNANSQQQLNNRVLSEIRLKSFEYAKKLEPYLEEASDRLGDIGYRCTFDSNQNVRLVDKMFNPSYMIQINCYELSKNKIKSFNEMTTFPKIGKKHVSKEELEEIEVIMIDLIDKFDYLELKIENRGKHRGRYSTTSTIPGLFSIRSRIINSDESFYGSKPGFHYPALPSTKGHKTVKDVLNEIEDYLENESEVIDRMKDIGFKYILTQYGQDHRFYIYFSRI